MEKGGDFGELEVLFTGGLILTALEMSHGFGGDFVSGSYCSKKTSTNEILYTYVKHLHHTIRYSNLRGAFH